MDGVKNETPEAFRRICAGIDQFCLNNGAGCKAGSEHGVL